MATSQRPRLAQILLVQRVQVAFLVSGDRRRQHRALREARPRAADLDDRLAVDAVLNCLAGVGIREDALRGVHYTVVDDRRGERSGTTLGAVLREQRAPSARRETVSRPVELPLLHEQQGLVLLGADRLIEPVQVGRSGHSAERIVQLVLTYRD